MRILTRAPRQVPTHRFRRIHPLEVPKKPMKTLPLRIVSARVVTSPDRPRFLQQNAFQECPICVRGVRKRMKQDIVNKGVKEMSAFENRANADRWNVRSPPMSYRRGQPTRTSGRLSSQLPGTLGGAVPSHLATTHLRQ